MPRAKRICFSGAVYHVLQRGNSKQRVYIDDVDRWHFLKLVHSAKKDYGVLIYLYALMDNHFHLTLETPNATPVSKIMQYINGSYAVYFNKRHGRVGHLFQGRFKDIIVEKETYLLQLSRYIHLNPVRAGFVDKPESYRWSSYDIYIGERKDKLVDMDMVLSYFGSAANGETSKNRYRNFVEDGLRSIDDCDWLKKNLKKRRYLGSDTFIHNLSAESSKGVRPPRGQKVPDPF